MKASKYFGLFIATTVIAMLASCGKTLEIEDENDNSAQGFGSLVVRTAASVDGSTEENDYVNYPVSVYVMDSDGHCTALKEIASADEQLKIELAEGTYDIYAVAGTANYDLPTASEASKEHLLSPQNGKGHGDLMTACSNVVMAKGEENKLTLQLQRRVMQIQSVTLNNMPSDVDNVQLSISPLKKGITLNGDYATGTDSHTFDLVKQADGTTWKSSASEYLLESQGNITLKVSLTRADGTTAYSYASEKQLAANHKVNITGNFVDDEHISLSGTIMGEDWAETVDLDFDFDSTNATTGDDDDPNNPNEGGNGDETLHGDAPQAGTIYNGCYVLRTVSEGNCTTVTLITPTEANKIKVSSSKDEETKQQSIKDNTATALSEIAVSGISGWRLPTQEEVKYIDDNIDDINAKIESLGTSGITSIEVKNGRYYCGYFFTSDDGNVYVYELGGGDINKSPGTDRVTYKVRGFATIKFTD